MSYTNQTHVSRREQRATLSRHALKRAQQRGLEQSALPLLLAYGHKEYDGKGGVRYLMTDAAIQNLSRVVGWTKQVEALAGVYAVLSVDDQTVITMGHRYN